MGTTKKNVALSKRHRDLSEATTKALKKVSEKLIAEAKATNSYLVVGDANGNVKRRPAKDL